MYEIPMDSIGGGGDPLVATLLVLFVYLTVCHDNLYVVEELIDIYITLVGRYVGKKCI
jgi:hypothetical protein